jgi:predicted enzyme related to lactoylglutathione lyase
MLSYARMDATIPVVDMKRAKQFYGKTLGLKQIALPDPGFASQNAFFQIGDCSRILMYERPGSIDAQSTSAVLLIDDLEKAVDELTERGVRFERYDLPNLKTDKRGIARDNGSKGAWFKDSEGNIIGLSEE